MKQVFPTKNWEMFVGKNLFHYLSLYINILTVFPNIVTILFVELLLPNIVQCYQSMLNPLRI